MTVEWVMAPEHYLALGLLAAYLGACAGLGATASWALFWGAAGIIRGLWSWLLAGPGR